MFQSANIDSPSARRGFRLSAVLLWIGLLAFLNTQSVAQDSGTRAATEQRLEELRELISKDEARLSRAQSEERATLKTLRDLDRQIAMREELMRNYRQRMDQLQLQQDSLRTSLDQLEADLEQLKIEYRGRARHAYMYGRMHDVALILAAESINQMLIRAQYLKRFSNQRRTRLDAIRLASSALYQQREELSASYTRNEQLLQAAEEEQSRLTTLKNSRSKVVRQLRRERQSIEKELNASKSTVQQLESRIRDLVASTANRSDLSAEARRASSALSANFENNRGKFGWPARGVVREPFGEIVNPVNGTTVPNPGVLIATESSAAVSAVFDGRIISIDIIPDFGTYVVIEHGQYHTVYSNFSLLYVGKNEIVTSGQVIGRAGTDAEPKGAGIFFAVFKQGVPMDPTGWLKRL